MMPDYARSERIAIRVFDGHLTESEAIRLTDAEIKASEPNENILRIQRLRERKKLDDAGKRHKHSPRNYD